MDFYVNPDEEELFYKYRDIVFEVFYPKRGNRLRLSVGKKAISDFRKLGLTTDLLADLMLYYVETGVMFTEEYGSINEGFYSSLEKTYVAALTLMKKEGVLDKFARRAAKVVSDTRGIGWGFHDYLADVYADFYPDPNHINDDEAD